MLIEVDNDKSFVRDNDMAKTHIELHTVDPKEHYKRQVAPLEHTDLDECEVNIKNIGWTLGNDCPYRCTHCYSMSAREKGQNLSIKIVNRIVDQLAKNGVETVNLGGNEPIFTNGLSTKQTHLPYIIDHLTEIGIDVGLTTSGITAIVLEKDYSDSFAQLNDVDISLDSPFEAEHNTNRGASLYRQALRALEICQDYGIARTIIMCGMNWNFSAHHLEELVNLAAKYDAQIRINPLKPVETQFMAAALTPEQYYEGFALLMKLTNPIDLGEPPLATMTRYEDARGCPCGRTSFRIHSITPDGKVPVSPCVYLHDYKVGNLVNDELFDIVRTPQFKSFRRRNANPNVIPGCEDCAHISWCKGGCAARSYLHHMHETGQRSLFVKDPYCPAEYSTFQDIFPKNIELEVGIKLVHQDYLCTWIGKPK